jgi:PhzF family phenazine biosynthesis protein
MSILLFQVDAFTSEPFSGNPAGVCLLREPRDDRWMQNVAREMNLADTAFLQRRAHGFDLRWFTPSVEVDLCGHATLASAHILTETGELPPDKQARFHTRSGLLTAERRGEWIELDFPVTPAEPVEAPPDLIQSLGVPARAVAKSRFDYLVEIEDERTLRTLEPDLRRLRTVPARGVIVTSRASTAGVDFVSRFFAPQSGIDEDPVTGSAHCCLAHFWSERLGKDEFLAHQVSRRGGILRVRLNGDRALLGGQAVTVLRGELVE